MRNLASGLFFVTAFCVSTVALADNPISTDQLLRAAQISVKATQMAEPDMAKSISGFRTVTVGANVQVTVDMKADGMNMSSKYLCVAQAQDMACRAQQ